MPENFLSALFKMTIFVVAILLICVFRNYFKKPSCKPELFYKVVIGERVFSCLHYSPGEFLHGCTDQNNNFVTMISKPTNVFSESSCK